MSHRNRAENRANAYRLERWNDLPRYKRWLKKERRRAQRRDDKRLIAEQL